jgi:UDP-N-acetylglucosamine acyltransferase
VSTIHPLACIDPGAHVGNDVTVGPFCHVGAGVRLGDGCVLQTHVTILGPCEVGPRNTFFPNCVIGTAPQDLKYKGGPTRVVIGEGNLFRENVTVHRGTEIDRSGGTTSIGDQNLLMVGVHIAHDCEIGNHCILANHVLLAGHVKLEDCVNVGGACAMHHFVTVGRNAFVSGMTRVTHDVPPFAIVQGFDQEVRGLNVNGLERWKFADASTTALREAYKLIYPRRGDRLAGRTLDAIREIESNGLMDDAHVKYLVEFLKRKLEYGTHGRFREHFRADSPADRGSFYQKPEGEPTA